MNILKRAKGRNVQGKKNASSVRATIGSRSRRGSGQVGATQLAGTPGVPRRRSASFRGGRRDRGRRDGEGLIGRQLTIEDIDGRVARRTALHAARQAVSTAAMLANPGPDGGDDDGGSQATQMAADSCARRRLRLRADPPRTPRSRRCRMPSRRSSRNGPGGRGQPQSVRRRPARGRSVARGWPSRGSILGARRRRGMRTRRERPRSFRTSPRPFCRWSSRRGGGSESGGRCIRARRDSGGGAAGVLGDCPARRWGRDRFRGRLERLAPGAADWASIAVRERRRPERYSEYVSH